MTRSTAAAQLTLPVGERDHVLGPASAPVTLVEYGDLECPHCRAAHPVVKEILQQLGPKVRFAFRHFPLTQAHPHAQHAAEATEAAGAQGQFWSMQDVIFQNQEALEDTDLVQYAAALPLDADRFANELAASVYAPRVRQDFMSGVRSGVNGTPTFFINGGRYDGSYRKGPLLGAIEAVMEDTAPQP